MKMMKKFDLSCGKVKMHLKDKEMYWSHIAGQTDGDPSQTECNICERSTRVESDFSTYIVVDPCMQ